ncbi:MAG TPA: Asp-tRNA(Asn)/Glu-tRNA(Gln) amidotransferase subunit GatB [Flavobacteriales bacterium]|nr:Asp-tRNA(Asn)/Glu-tRNA(Gln) amidotransferase subunit GatB [Flavobacteriales bacterium]
MSKEKYEPVIGLEVHIQLLTDSKVFCADSTEYGKAPNTNVSPISLGHPGILPKFNEQVIDYAIRLGLACDCDIRRENEFARKNYFYADLPKGYQITQDKTPICTGGYIKIKDNDGNENQIGITRIHIEEDSGKSIHDQDPFKTLIDLNRAGVPLLEMVSEPEIRTPGEAYRFLTEVRKLVRYLGICDGNMEEGSMRCDANVSVRLKGEKKFGEKVEVKNMNSIRNVQRAIEYEIIRQVEALENEEKIFQETRNFDAVSGTTAVMRTKEMADDYRYFPEPDLPRVIISKEYIESVKADLPKLPNYLFDKYTNSLGLSEYDAQVITDSKSIAEFYEVLITHTKNYKAAANWLMGPIKSYLNENAKIITDLPVSAKGIADLIQLVEEGKISYSIASQKIFPLLINNPEKSPFQIAEDNNLLQESDDDNISEFVSQAIAKYPDKVIEYKNGKKGLIGLFMGEVMKLSKGKADPQKASIQVEKMLNE